MRPVISPCFTTSKMKQMFVLMKEVAETFVSYYKNMKVNDTIEVEMKDALTRYGNDVIASIAFGIQINSLKEENNEFYLMGKKATNLGGFWKTLKFLGYNVVPKLYEVRYYLYLQLRNILPLKGLDYLFLSIHGWVKSKKLEKSILCYWCALDCIGYGGGLVPGRMNVQCKCKLYDLINKFQQHN